MKRHKDHITIKVNSNDAGFWSNPYNVIIATITALHIIVLVLRWSGCWNGF